MKNLSKFENFLKDFFGAFGDTGTFIPIALGMITICNFPPTSVFLPAGILYVISAFFYKIPVPVQPLKAVAAIALVNKVKPEIISTSAYLMSALMVIFIFLDFSKYLEKIFSKPLIRGVQFGVGMLLLRNGIELIFGKDVISVLSFQDSKFNVFSFGPPTLSLFLPTFDNLLTAFLILIIPQIPLTFGNSIVATSNLAKEYFGERAKKVNHNNLAKTIAIGNFFAGLLSGIPLCHGSGGLTAHYRMGARTERANLIIGFTYIGIALISTEMSLYFLRKIPLFLFGLSLFFIGIFHSLLAKDLRNGKDLFIVIVMGFISILFKNLSISLIAGVALKEAFNSIFQEKKRLERTNIENRRKEEKINLFDKYNRAIKYLRISLTENCNLRCLYCMRNMNLMRLWKKDFLTNSEIFRLAKIAVSLGIEKIRLTGGEPLLREGIVELVEKISSIDNLKDLSLSTNGTLLDKYALSLRNAGLKRINISLDTLDERKFELITGRRVLRNVITGIREAMLAGFNPIKINVVVLRGVNDNELDNFIKFGQENGLIIRFIEFMPLIFYDEWRKYFVSRREIIEKISSFIDFKTHVSGSALEPAQYFNLKNGGRVGIISPVSHGFCGNCSRLRLTADGFLRGCMTYDIEIDVKTPIRSGAKDEDIAELFKKAVLLKPKKGIYNRRIKREMFQIGG